MLLKDWADKTTTTLERTSVLERKMVITSLFSPGDDRFLWTRRGHKQNPMSQWLQKNKECTYAKRGEEWKIWKEWKKSKIF